jgi:hypothetical protein
VVVLDAAGIVLHELDCWPDSPPPSPWVLRLPPGACTCEVRDADGRPLWQSGFAVREQDLQLQVPLG